MSNKRIRNDDDGSPRYALDVEIRYAEDIDNPYIRTIGKSYRAVVWVGAEMEDIRYTVYTPREFKTVVWRDHKITFSLKKFPNPEYLYVEIARYDRDFKTGSPDLTVTVGKTRIPIPQEITKVVKLERSVILNMKDKPEGYLGVAMQLTMEQQQEP